METLELIQAISPTTNKVGSAFYFHPETLAKGKEAGLDGFRLYVLGRGGVLGDVESAVVASAFAYFHPGTVAKIWNSAKEVMAPRAAAALYHQCCADLGATALADMEGLEAYNEAAEAVVAATELSGFSLFAGWSAEPRSEDPAARAMQLIAILRELRGDAHIVALRATGLAAPVAHAIKRPDDVATFGWEVAPTVAGGDHAKYDDAEALTDQLLIPSYVGLSDAQAAALVAGTEAIGSALS